MQIVYLLQLKEVKIFRTLILTALAACALAAFAPASWAKPAAPRPVASGHGRKMVGYDAKDKRYYSVAWAKAHGMHDKGGDPLTIVPFASLPKEARESKAMKGAKI